jgi:glutamyl-tRNA reductase
MGGHEYQMTTSSPFIIADSLEIINARITYRDAPIHLLEKFTFKDLHHAHRLLLEKAQLRECIIIQTCNRVEVFAISSDANGQRLLEQWASAVNLSNKEFENIVHVKRGKDVIYHLLKLASGLDSLVVGEDQVLGQIRRALEFSRKNHYTGSHLQIIFDRAVKVGSRIRTHTGLNKGSVSIGSMAVRLAEEYFDNLNDKRIMLIGSGEGASLIAKSLKQHHVNFMVTSRTFERAKSFADTVAGVPIPFESALEMFNDVNLIFVSTNAPYYLVTYDRVEKSRRNAKEGLLIFDLSNPRTVEDKVATIKKVKLINIDQISEIVEKNIRARKNEIQSAEKIINNEMESVDSLLKRRKVEPIVVSIFKNVDVIRERELKKALSIIGKSLGPKEAKTIEELSYALVEGILSTPMNNLRKEIELSNENEELMRVVSKLFKYEDKYS